MSLSDSPPSSAGARAADPLAQAAVFAGRAPSLHNSQPWRWDTDGHVLDLRLERSRVLTTSDPEGRFAILSCGAALHHARIHLAAHGWQAVVQRLPDDADTDLLARVRLGQPAPDDPDAGRLAAAAERRHTDRSVAPRSAVDPSALATIQAVITDQGAELVTVLPDQISLLVEAAERALGVEADDPGWQVEVNRWVGGERTRGLGIPTAALPADPSVLFAPVRALRRAAAAVLAEPNTSVFAVLRGPDDEARSWLRGGEALSAGWLTATELGISVLPLSIVLEVAGSRDVVRRLLGWSGRPYLVLRFATADRSDAGSPLTPRLPAHETVHRR
jgi:hypothetical protein